MKHKKRKVILLGFLGVLVALFVVCAVYVSDYYRAGDIAASALQSDVTVAVESGDPIVFTPKQPKAGFIFYPGGKVEYTAYAPLMRALAQQGVLCVLLEMPFNLAVLDSSAAEGIPAQYPEVDRWYIGGHSLGGSMAASYAADHADVFSGVILLASYSTADLRECGFPVLSLYGSNDGVLNMEKYQTYRENLPVDTTELIIDGGNHAGFGDYGAQEGDLAATISPDVQLADAAEYCAAFILSD